MTVNAMDLYNEEQRIWQEKNPDYSIMNNYDFANDLVSVEMLYGKDNMLVRVWHSDIYNDIGGPGFTEQLDDIKRALDRKMGIGREMYVEDDYDYGKMSKREIWAD